MIKQIISGGQTGADIGGLIASELLGIPRGGFCPENYSDENGFNSDFIPRFGLVGKGSLKERTVYNIAESDATVIFSKEIDSPGTQTTIAVCDKMKKPFYIVKSLNGLKKFLSTVDGVLNVAGNRESVSVGIQNRVIDFMSVALMPDNGVFVFGSNSEGVHGAGAAKVAKDYFGAIQGSASGLMGRSYGIITKKDFRRKKSSSLEEIQIEINKFYDFAKSNTGLAFFVPEIGCHLAGYHYTDIAKLFKRFYDEPLYNVVLPVRFRPGYCIDKMMDNSEFAHNYNTLDETESKIAREIYEKNFVDKFGISVNDDAEIYLGNDQESMLCSHVERFVVGDHGIYAEIKPENMKMKLECMKGKEYKHEEKYNCNIKYYDENPVGYDGVLIYNQVNTVKYADYKAGMYYVSPDDVFKIKKIEHKELYLEKIEKRNEEVSVNISVKEDKKETNEEKKKGDFVHLHLHSSNSLLDGLCEFPELFSRMKEVGQDTVALTDHGYLYGAYKFQKEADKCGITPIHGVEAYFANDALDKTNRMSYHLILLVMNEIGWKNLCHMMTVANRERFYYKPRIDEALLREYNEGLICSTACYKSPVSYHLTEEGYDPERAMANALFLKNTFGDRLYNEVMHIGFDSYDSICPRILELADKLKLRTIATNDTHYVKREDASLQQTLMNINTEGTLKSESNELFLKSRSEMITDYVTEEMCNNTLEVAERCKFRLDFSGYKFPKFDIEKQKDYKQFLKETRG